jgi:hypothetical protein
VFKLKLKYFLAWYFVLYGIEQYAAAADKQWPTTTGRKWFTDVWLYVSRREIVDTLFGCNAG